MKYRVLLSGLAYPFKTFEEAAKFLGKKLGKIYKLEYTTLKRRKRI